MLSENEKKEFIQDGLDVRRREAFRKARSTEFDRLPPLDVYMRFLSKVQRVFSSLDPTCKNSVSKSNKL